MEAKGQNFELGAIFVEREDRPFESLMELCGGYADEIDVRCRHGELAANIAMINESIQKDPAFVFVDPTGWIGAGMRNISKISNGWRDVLVRVPSEVSRFKAEVVVHPDRDPKNNTRFVVTNLTMTPKNVYKFYFRRGDAENRIKELKNDLAMDRTSCSRFLASQFRVLLTAAVYVILQEVQINARHSDCAQAQVSTIRNQLLKLAARVVVSARRVVIHLPRQFPGLPAWQRVALATGARVP